MSKKKNKKRKLKKKIKIFLFIIVVLFLVFLGIYFIMKSERVVVFPKYDDVYLASDVTKIKTLVKEEDNYISGEELVRGTKATTKNKIIVYNDTKYKEIYINDNVFYVNPDNIVSSVKDVVLEKKMYVKIPSTAVNALDDIKIVFSTSKSDELEVVDFDSIDSNGNVNRYKVRFNDKEGYVDGKYLSFDLEDAKLNYNQDMYDNVYSKVNDNYGGGDASKLNIFPHEKISFENNIMPKSVYSLYLNCGSEVINNIDNYIEFAKTTKINSFVVDIKDNESPAFPADTFKELSPTNYNKAINSYEKYKEAIDKIKNAGFYVIGRITTFKDSSYINDNPGAAILNTNTGKPYYHNGSYWPSAYNRDVWYYNVRLAKEAVTKFGFNEINFDYVRFPDRMQSVASIVDLKNTYNESKIQAIERFVRYASDELHRLNVYVSIDVFGETSNGTYTTAYGQYWPAISNEADVISGMPYPDHFANYSYGIASPWNNPYRLLNTWGKNIVDRQKETVSPAKVRTWIQAYDVMKHVDANGINYNSSEVQAEIKGLFDAGLRDGYITWLSSSNLYKYKLQKGAYDIDYWEEYNNG